MLARLVTTLIFYQLLATEVVWSLFFLSLVTSICCPLCSLLTCREKVIFSFSLLLEASCAFIHNCLPVLYEKCDITSFFALPLICTTWTSSDCHLQACGTETKRKAHVPLAPAAQLKRGALFSMDSHLVKPEAR